MKQSYSASLFSFLSAIPSFPPHPNRDRALRKVNPPRGQTSQTLDQKFRSGHVYANSLFPVRETVECLLNASIEAVNLVNRVSGTWDTRWTGLIFVSLLRASGGGEFVEGDEANALLRIKCVVTLF